MLLNHRGASRFATIHRGASRFATIHRGASRFATIHRGASRFATIHRGASRFAINHALLVSALAVTGLAGAASAAEDPTGGKFTLEESTKGLPGSGKLVATIETSMGTFTCDLFDKEAPNTVANFVGLARGLRPYKDPKSNDWVKKPFYDGLSFHRVIPGFMIQGGDILGNGTGEPGYTIQDEQNAPHNFSKGGMLAMANRGPNTGGSQFFITEGPTEFLDDGKRPNAHYQIFGECQDPALVKKITAVPRNGNDKPNTDVKIVKVTIKHGGGKSGKKAKPTE